MLPWFPALGSLPSLVIQHRHPPSGPPSRHTLSLIHTCHSLKALCYSNTPQTQAHRDHIHCPIPHTPIAADDFFPSAEGNVHFLHYSLFLTIKLSAREEESVCSGRRGKGGHLKFHEQEKRSICWMRMWRKMLLFFHMGTSTDTQATHKRCNNFPSDRLWGLFMQSVLFVLL